MPFEITELTRSPEHRVAVHIYNVDQEGFLSAGDRIRLQVKIGNGPIANVVDEIVPAGKIWKEVHFQFQAFEDNL